ncbi:unnamed protein product, partial [Iphiclides podalirius]
MADDFGDRRSRLAAWEDLKFEQRQNKNSQKNNDKKMRGRVPLRHVHAPYVGRAKGGAGVEGAGCANGPHAPRAAVMCTDARQRAQGRPLACAP